MISTKPSRSRECWTDVDGWRHAGQDVPPLRTHMTVHAPQKKWPQGEITTGCKMEQGVSVSYGQVALRPGTPPAPPGDSHDKGEQRSNRT